MSKHTPGPWSTDAVVHQPITKMFSAHMITDQQGSNIAIGSMWMDTPESMAEAEANARLIAESPKLLEALEALVEYVDEMHRLGHIQRPVQSSVAVAAIARAKGAE